VEKDFYVKRFLRDLFEEACKEQLNFAIVRGLDTSKSSISDVDLVTNDIKAFKFFLNNFANSHNCICLKEINRHYVTIIRILSLGSPVGCFSVKIDLHRHEQWRGVTYLHTSNILARKIVDDGFPRYSSGDALIANLFQWALNSPVLSESRKSRILKNSKEFFSESHSSINKLSIPVSVSILTSIEQPLISGYINQAANTIYRKKWLIWLYIFFKSPIATSISLSKTVLHRVGNFLYPRGVFISIIGPDGAGKSTLIKSLREDLNQIAPGELSTVQHWRPNFLTPLSKIKVSDSKGQFGFENKSSRNQSFNNHTLPKFTESLIRYSYYITDYVLGYYFKIRPLLTRDGMVICDRYVEDYQLAPSFRSRVFLPKRLKKLLAFFVPKAPLTFYLRANPEILHLRKKEETLEELNYLVNKYDSLAGSNKRIIVLDANIPTNEIVAEVFKYISNYYKS
jgi:thymidylate kinase